jgi:hypothetical protein
MALGAVKANEDAVLAAKYCDINKLRSRGRERSQFRRVLKGGFQNILDICKVDLQNIQVSDQARPPSAVFWAARVRISRTA